MAGSKIQRFDSIEELLAAYRTTPHGLTRAEADERLLRVGSNEIETSNHFSNIARFFAQFGDLMVVILIFAGFLALIFREFRDAAVIFLIVLINATIGFWQEFKAEKTLAKLAALVPRAARVWRGGRVVELHRSDIVPGDVVELTAGDTVPADGWLLAANDLKLDESAMTGESLPVTKMMHGEGDDRVMMGTVVRNGTGTLLVTETGNQTQFGHIAISVGETEKDHSPLAEKLRSHAKRVAQFCAAVLIVIMLYGILTGRDLEEQFFFGLALAVSIVPEGLPAILSVILARSAHKLARKHALVKRLASVETLGAVTVICTDKTGTITQNNMVVDRIWAAPSRKMSELARVAILANNAHLDADKTHDLGDPMEIALARWATTSADSYLRHHTQFPRVREFPFIEARKMMSVVIESRGRSILLAKGAPEAILAKAKLAAGHRATLQKTLVDWQRQGYRVLAVAERPLTKALANSADRDRVERELTLIGLIALADPPRPDAAQAVTAARGAGIRVIMITGDSPQTAAAIARRVGILRPGEDTVIACDEFERLSPAQLREILLAPAVFARMNPTHKLTIVDTLKEMGEVVAVTGDGVNDGPALKRADIGIAMGKVGTDVAREAADMILLDDHFSTIIRAIEHGRLLYANIKKTIWYIFSHNMSEVFTVVFAAIVQIPLLPIQAVQILAIDLGNDVLPAYALASDTNDSHVMHEKPRPKHDELLPKAGYYRLLLLGTVIGLGSLATFLFVMGGTAFAGDNTPEHLYARATMAVYATIVLCQIVNIFESRSPHRSVFQMHFLSHLPLIFAALFSIGLMLAIVYIPPLTAALKGAPLHPMDWVVAGSFAIFFLIVEEIRKWYVRQQG